MAKRSWSLEVVRGREVGRVYPVGPAGLVLGNDPGPGESLNLGPQEGPSPRKMAARQARLEWFGGGLTLADLESPAGTFVNRQRLLPGQARALAAGDLIQLGPVQLKVVENEVGALAESPPVSDPAPPLFAFVLADGSRCRNWDDFLSASARSWTGLREELRSGRIESYLRSVGRADLVPDPGLPLGPDEQLDAWLGRLPASRPAAAELEIQPERFQVRAIPGGGSTRLKLELISVGYRLLRSKVRVEPPGTSWLLLGPEAAVPTILTPEHTTLSFDVEIPSRVDQPLLAYLVVESNGGARRAEVRVAPTRPAGFESEGLSARLDVGGGSPWSRWGERSSVSLATLAGGTGVGIRLLLFLGERLAPDLRGAPSLRGGMVVLAVIGAAVGAGLALRYGEKRDLPPLAFTGACAGVFGAAVGVALCRSVEPWLGGLAGSPVLACLFWGLVGAGISFWTRGRGTRPAPITETAT